MGDVTTNNSNLSIARPFISKTTELFENDFSMRVLNLEVDPSSIELPTSHITYACNLSGQINGQLIFSFEPKLAQKLLDSFPYVEYTPDVQEEMKRECVAEFLNIVIGNAMSNLPTNELLNFSVPLHIAQTLDTKNTLQIKICFEEGNMLFLFKA